MTDISPLALYAGVLCPEGYGAGSVSAVAFSAAVGLPWDCHCGRTHSAWESVLQMLKEPSDLWHAIALAGGGQSMARLMVSREDRRVVLRSHEIGVPEGAQALRLIFTPVGQPIALCEVGQSIGRRFPLPETLVLTPINCGAEADENWESVEMSVSVPWAPTVPMDRAHELMISALTAFGDGDWKRAALDADTSIAEAVAPPCNALTQLVKAKERFGPFQGLAMIEVAAKSQGLPILHEPLREQLYLLRKLRNGRAAHGGGAIDCSELAEPLAAAVCAFWWLHQIAPAIASP